MLLVSSGIPVLFPLCRFNTFYLLLFEEDTPSQWEIEETVRFKDLYDQDKDGKLNREEQLRWVAPNSYGSAREEVRLTVPTCTPFFIGIINQIDATFLGFNTWQGLYIISAPDTTTAYSLTSFAHIALMS